MAEDQWGLFTRRQAERTGMAWTTLARLARDNAAERVARGVYRLRGTPPVDHLALRAAWLQLSPDTPVWQRTAAQGVVSHRSAAAVYGLGHLPADVHHLIVPVRRQSRRPDVRLHRADLAPDEWTTLAGLPVTRPARTAADLLADREDPGAVAQVVADALRGVRDDPGTVARAIAPYAGRFGLADGDGLALLEWLLGLTDDPERDAWMKQAATIVREPRRDLHAPTAIRHAGSLSPCATDRLRSMAAPHEPWPLPDLQRQFAYDRLLTRQPRHNDLGPVPHRHRR